MSKPPDRITVACPCCGTQLVVESQTGLVVTHSRKKSDYSFEKALEKESTRKSKAEELFNQAFEDEKRRKNSLEEKFRQALELKDELEEPPHPWEMD